MDNVLKLKIFVITKSIVLINLTKFAVEVAQFLKTLLQVGRIKIFFFILIYQYERQVVMKIFNWNARFVFLFNFKIIEFWIVSPLSMKLVLIK